MQSYDPIGLIVTIAALSFIPFLAITSTAFLKISSVLLILRTALGLQQVPANMAIYGVSMVMTLLVMGPIFGKAADAFKSQDEWPSKGTEILAGVERAAPAFKEFMTRHSQPGYVDQIHDTAKQFQTKYGGPPPLRDDWSVVMPAFVISELSAAFKIGLAIFLPFVVVDLVVSSILMALGMMMVSPMSITLPVKLVLFVAIEGWLKILQGLVGSYM
ncbi:type III secretion system export apparatus subunit SctR [Limnobacter humi]|uniref:Type III secretion system export apparatus subunit SctR n=1 Tax=Limnobacter humi TaxID=1778671 RepID=A0ABT1WDH7_9BURK|nr:type III secretion system export apparatus subunit SctR [Limnobacter humi]MCQ8895550.1 type III secretion system export apparatus subunit SctR [Limnobacter humi]